MDNLEILNNVKKYFKAYELVGPEVYAIYGEDSFQFMDSTMLHTLYVIRKALNKPITINNWKWGGRFSQRGFRSNIQDIVSEKTYDGVLYLSGHVLGKAIDFNVVDMSANEVIEWLLENQDMLPYKIRVEDDEVERVHIDMKYLPSNPKVYLFKP